MTYRNDHESALARIDALEAENARLVEQNEELRGKLDALDALQRTPREGLAVSARWGARIGFSTVVTLLTIAGGALGIWGMWQGCQSGGGGGSSWTERTVTGRMDVAGKDFGGTWTLVPGTCSSGQVRSFYGVDVVDQTDPKKILRIIDDPTQGMLLKINVPGTELARLVARTDCKTWDVQLRPTNNYINDVRLLDGNVALDCALRDGSTLAGRLEFKGCH